MSSCPALYSPSSNARTSAMRKLCCTRRSLHRASAATQTRRRSGRRPPPPPPPTACENPLPRCASALAWDGSRKESAGSSRAAGDRPALQAPGRQLRQVAAARVSGAAAGLPAICKHVLIRVYCSRFVEQHIATSHIAGSAAHSVWMLEIVSCSCFECIVPPFSEEALDADDGQYHCLTSVRVQLDIFTASYTPVPSSSTLPTSRPTAIRTP